jgi:hypothetical protein
MMSDKKSKKRLIAFYLPQFHQISENDQWWGKGFTEWTNVGKAKPLFPGHYQPRVPADLGYYDLRIPEVRKMQADLAREAGIEGFCYWHYWFGNGKRLLERPFNEVLESGKPDFPFCLCWANHSWYAKKWNNDSKDKLLIEQTYPGVEDYINHFNSMLPALKDKRYMKVDNKPIFGIYEYKNFPDMDEFSKIWNRLAIENGFNGMYFITISYKFKDNIEILKKGYDAIIFDLLFLRKTNKRYLTVLFHKLFHFPQLIDYRDYTKTLLKNMPIDKKVLPCIYPNYDHSPRSGRRGSLMTHTNPKNWLKLLTGLFSKIENKSGDDNIVFIKSWNEWGEGNYLEPDLKYGNGYLDALKKAHESFK